MTPINAFLLAYLRLSRDSDGSASIDTQRAAYLAWMDSAEFKRWLADNGLTRDQVEVIEYVDAGVSGAKPLEQRKDMRRLMQDVAQGGNNVKRMMIAWKLDRYARNVSEFLRLTAWGEARNVRIATTDNTINTSTPTGRMVAVVLAALAQWEREMTRDRITDGHATRRTQGRWTSGMAPFPYMIVRRDGVAYLAPDPVKVPKARAGVQALIDGGTVTSSATHTGLSDIQWRRLLKSPTLRGHRLHKGKLVVGEDGITPVQFADPIISAAEQRAIHARLLALANGTERAPRSAAPMTSGASWCYQCGRHLTGGTNERGAKLVRCKRGHVSIYAWKIDQRVEHEFITRYGDFAEHVVRLEGGNDLTDQLIEAEEQAERLAQRMGTAGPLMLASLEKHAEELEAAYAALKAAHSPEVREVLEPTGRTLREAWRDETARNRLLHDMGLSVTLYPADRDERLEITWATGGDDHALADVIGEMEAAK